MHAKSENTWIAVGIILISGIAVYINSLYGDFIWDDIEQIVENPVITDTGNIPSFFTSDLWRLIGNPTIGSNYYRPLFLLSLTFDYHFWGLNPLGYHITNLILHSIASLLVYLVGKKIFRDGIPALAGGIIFAVHPIHVESVAWISGRTDPLAALFMLLSIYLYILFRERNNIILLVSALAVYLLALLSKEMAVTLPLLLAAYEFSTNKEVPKKTAVASLWPVGLFVIVSAAYLIVRTSVLGEAVGIASSSSPPLYMRIYTSFGIILDYLRIAIIPINLKILYDIPPNSSFISWGVLFPFLLLISLFIASCLAYYKEKTVFFLSMWFFITIVPVSNIVPLKPTMMAERYMYIPSVGLCLFVGFLYHKLCAMTSFSKHTWGLIIIILAALSIITVQRNKLWLDEKTYFERSTKDAPDNAYAHHNLGEAYRKTGQLEKAIEEWKNAIKLYPMHPEANNSLANMELMRGNYTEAINRYKIALQGNHENSEAYYNLGLALERVGRMDEAVLNYREFIRTASPKYRDIANELTARINSSALGSP